MKLGICKVTNFGSYKDCELDLQNVGLTLISGNTGSGKSTILDMPCWVLYGVTAKGGSVDSIKSWTANADPTTGELEVLLHSGNIKIYRKRGKSNENDLYWTDSNTEGKIYRGKDLAETQKHLETRLGVSQDLYISGSYFHEFSPTSSFFTAKAKDRRETFAKIANLRLAELLAERTKDAKWETKGQLETEEKTLFKVQTELNQLEKLYTKLLDSFNTWNEHQKIFIQSLKTKYHTFADDQRTKVISIQNKFDNYEQQRLQTVEELKSSINELNDAIRSTQQEYKECKYCGSVPKNISDLKRIAANKVKLEAELKQRIQSENPYTDSLQSEKLAENHFLTQYNQELSKENPYTDKLEDLVDSCDALKSEENALISTIDKLSYKISLLSTLNDLSYTLRANLLQKAVQQVQDNTNRYLDQYFDSIIKVSLALDGEDSLNTDIQKNGYTCSYKQLSKGQRGLLKLCFTVAIMNAASNCAGIHFDNLFFDEALDGLDVDLKVKAFSLFEELQTSHKSILLIDHAVEFQQMFHKRYSVELIADNSQVTCEE